MAQNMMSGADAKRYLRAGQLAAAVLGVAAVSLWALDVPGMNRLPEPPVAKPAETPVDQPAIVQTPRIDSEGVTGLAERLDEARVKAPVVVAEAPQEEKPPENAGPEWSFLGPIFEATRSLAIVSVDGHQKVLAQGRKFGETTLVSVSQDQIVIDGPGGRRTIYRAERPANLAVAWVNQPIASANNPNIPANMGRGNGMSPEVQARIRERMESRQAQGRGGPGNNNNGREGDRRSRGGRAEAAMNAAVMQGLPPGAAPQTVTVFDADAGITQTGGRTESGDDASAADGVQIVRPRREGIN